MLRIAVPNKGSLAETAAEMLAEAGADTFVAGSAVYGADDIEAAVTRLRELAGTASLES
jgi:ribulose-phosphate 3-epimerase